MNGVKIMNEEPKVLRIGIEGHWEAREFAESLHVLDYLYTMRLLIALEFEDLREYREHMKLYPPPFFHGESSLLALVKLHTLRSDLLEPQERLAIQRIHYGSPGIKDVIGIGEIIKHLKDFLIHLIDLAVTKRRRELENERRQLENQKLQIENAKKFVELAQKCGCSKTEMRQLVGEVVRASVPLQQLAAAGKITSAETIDAHQSETE
jgi:hypothetical protein